MKYNFSILFYSYTTNILEDFSWYRNFHLKTMSFFIFHVCHFKPHTSNKNTKIQNRNACRKIAVVNGSAVSFFCLTSHQVSFTFFTNSPWFTTEQVLLLNINRMSNCIQYFSLVFYSRLGRVSIFNSKSKTMLTGLIHFTFI